MDKVKIAGRKVFPIGLGTLNMGDNPGKRAQEINAIQMGLDHGVQVIDTAEMYGSGNSEQLVGKAIKPYLNDRDNLFIISKVLPSNASKEQLPISLNKSLNRLGLDYLDLYLLHWHVNVPLIETVEALEKAKDEGKIKAWGVSNLDTEKMERVLNFPNGKHCATNQVRYNLASRGLEYDLLPLMQKNDMPLIAYGPVNRKDSSGTKIAGKKELGRIAQRHHADVYQILLAWCIKNGETIAIPQSSNPDHVLSNIKASQIQLTDQDLMEIDKIYPRPVSKTPLALW